MNFAAIALGIMLAAGCKAGTATDSQEPRRETSLAGTASRSVSLRTVSRQLSDSCLSHSTTCFQMLGGQLVHLASVEPSGTFQPSSSTNLIICHGVPGEFDGFVQESLHEERAFVFVSSSVPRPRNISKIDLRRALSGEITDWAELGGEAGPIRVFLHSGKLQRQKLGTVLNDAYGVNPLVDSSAVIVRPESSTTAGQYAELLKAAQEDPGALAIGIVARSTPGLSFVRVSGSDPLDDRSEYPLSMEIRAHWRENEAGSVAHRTYLGLLFAESD